MFYAVKHQQHLMKLHILANGKQHMTVIRTSQREDRRSEWQIPAFWKRNMDVASVEKLDGTREINGQCHCIARPRAHVQVQMKCWWLEYIFQLANIYKLWIRHVQIPAVVPSTGYGNV